MINISSYVNLGNEPEWIEFIKWYESKYGKCKNNALRCDSSPFEMVNDGGVTIAYQNLSGNFEHSYYVEANLYSLMIKEEKAKAEEDTYNQKINRLLRIEEAVKVMLEAHPVSGTKSHDPRYTTWVQCDKYAAVSDAFYRKEVKN